MFDIHVYDAEFEEPDQQVYYLLAANGLFQIKKTRFFVSSAQVFEPRGGKGLPWLKTYYPTMRLLLPAKVPLEFLQKALGFFRAVLKEYNGAEAIVLLYWIDAEQRYELVAPKQEVGTGTLPWYKVGENPDGWTRVGTIHSHCDGGAFHSPIDKNDEEHDDGIHITVGNISTIPSLSCSLVSDGSRIIMEPQEIIDGLPTAEFPEEWMGRVARRIYPAYRFQGPLYGGTMPMGTSSTGKKRGGRKGVGAVVKGLLANGPGLPLSGENGEDKP